MNGNLVTCRLKTLRHLQLAVLSKIDIKHPAASIAIEMKMLSHIRAIVHGDAIQVYLPHQLAFDQRPEAIVNRRHGNLWHTLFGPQKNLLRRRMIPFLDQNLIDVLPLRRQAETA